MKYKVRPGVVAASVCDSHFLVTADMTIRINETVAYYWEKLSEGADEDTIVAWANERYETEDELVLRADIRELIDSMLARHLLERCDT